jgi:hypothetical protein
MLKPARITTKFRDCDGRPINPAFFDARPRRHRGEVEPPSGIAIGPDSTCPSA